RRPPHVPEPPQPLHRQRRVLQRLAPVDERVERGVVDGRRAPELLADRRLLGGGVAPPLRLEVEHHLLADGEQGLRLGGPPDARTQQGPRHHEGDGGCSLSGGTRRYSRRYLSMCAHRPTAPTATPAAHSARPWGSRASAWPTTSEAVSASASPRERR